MAPHRWRWDDWRWPGAVTALVSLSRFHDRQLASLTEAPARAQARNA